MSHKVTDDPRDQSINEALGITDERADEIFEVVEEQLLNGSDIGASLQFLRSRSGYTPDEDAFALFMYGYGLREIELMNETMNAIGSLIDALDDGK